MSKSESAKIGMLERFRLGKGITREAEGAWTKEYLEIDALIAGMPTTVATFLQLLKETAMRSGEAKKLKWIDVDFERRSITLNEPEKGSLPRIFNTLTGKLLGMLNALPRKNSYVFGDCILQKITCWEAISNHDQVISLCDKCEKVYQKQMELENGE